MKTEEEIRARIRNLTEMLKYASLIEATLHEKLKPCGGYWKKL